MLLEAVVIGGALVSAYGKWQGGNAAEKAGKAAAREFERQAAETLQAGDRSAFIAGMQGRDVAAAARTGFATSGTDAEESVLRQTAWASELEVAWIEENARREAWGLRRRARLAREQGADAAQAARIEMAGSLISSGAALGAKMYTPGPGPAPSGSDFWGD